MCNDQHIFDLSIVVPFYNEREVFPAFTERLFKVLDNLNIACELIFVDDGSEDGTYDGICRLAGQDPRVLGLQLTRNFGKEAAILAGLDHACGRAVVVMDGDGQHPPELLPLMLESWRAGNGDIVAAVKRKRNKDPFLNRFAAEIFNWFMKSVTGLDLIGSSDYRLMDRRVVDSLLKMKERVRFFRGLSCWTGYREVHIPFDVPERMAGKSTWSTMKLIQQAFAAITSFTARPLVWVLGMGTFGVLISVILGLQALFSRISGVAVSGWTSLTLLILFFGSANLIAIGLVGIYLATIFQEVKTRPIYLLKNTMRQGEQS